MSLQYQRIIDNNTHSRQNSRSVWKRFLTNHPYYAQVQGEMAVFSVEWYDFVVYSNHTVIVDRIISDFSYWTQMIETLDNFYVRHIVPEILCGTIFKQEYDL